MQEFFRHALTGLAAFAGIAAWDVVRTWAFSRWMVRKIARAAAAGEAKCPDCGAKLKTSITLEPEQGEG